MNVRRGAPVELVAIEVTATCADDDDRDADTLPPRALDQPDPRAPRASGRARTSVVVPRRSRPAARLESSARRGGAWVRACRRSGHRTVNASARRWFGQNRADGSLPGRHGVNGKRALVWIAVVAGLALIALAVVYWALPGRSLPSWLPV